MAPFGRRRPARACRARGRSGRGHFRYRPWHAGGDDDGGERIGTVSGVIAIARGQVQHFVVMTEDGPATVPAANFTGEGSLLVSGMSEGKLEKVARQQEDQAAQTEDHRPNPDQAE